MFQQAGYRCVAALMGFFAFTAMASAQDKLGSVSISVVPSTSAVVLYVAEEHGLFEREGLQVDINEFASGSEAERAMVAGAVDMGSGGAGTTLIMANKGIKAKNVALFQGRPIFTLVTAKTLGAKPGDLEVLRGKNIGISSPGSLTDLFLRIILSTAGIDPDRDVTIVASGGLPSHLPALQTGRVHAQMTWEPATVAVTEEQPVADVLVDLRSDETIEVLNGLLGSSLQATDDWLQKEGNLDKAKAAARAVEAARKMILTDPKLMIPALHRIFPNLSDEVLAKIANAEAPSYAGRITPEAIQHMSEVYARAGLIANPVTYEQVVDPRIATEWD